MLLYRPNLTRVKAAQESSILKDAPFLYRKFQEENLNLRDRTQQNAVKKLHTTILYKLQLYSSKNDKGL
jgi:hypothetical protein